MARIESVAVAGYYPLPASLHGHVAAMLSVDEHGTFTALDPVAGDGAAIEGIVAAACAMKPYAVPRFIACELEGSRAKALSNRFQNHTHRAFHADAFSLRWDKEYGAGSGVSLLYLNPPYDMDPIHGRLEERFLERFAPTLATGGVLVFVVPVGAIAASARRLATMFTDLAVYRFPDAEYAAFKQVVIFATRAHEADGELIEEAPRQAILSLLSAASADPTSLPVLGGVPASRFAVPTHKYLYGEVGLRSIRVEALDVPRAQAAFVPWHVTSRTGKSTPVPNTPAMLCDAWRSAVYPMAAPPEPAHIAAAMASGVFDGAEVTSTTPGAHRLLVRGVFRRDFVLEQEKHDKNGNLTTIIEVQHPSLIVSVLDFETGDFYQLGNSPEPSGTTDPALMTVGDLLHHYGPALLARMREQCPVLFDPSRPGDVESTPIAPLERELWPVQRETAQAVMRIYQNGSSSATVLGEVGTGKTTVACALVATMKRKRTVIVCPPHVVSTWAEEIRACFGSKAQVHVLDSVTAVDKAATALTSDGPVFALLSRETAKLGYTNESVRDRCPACGMPVAADDFAKKRQKCSAQGRLIPANQQAEALSSMLLRLAPFDVSTLLTDAMRRAWPTLPRKQILREPSVALVDECMRSLVASMTEIASTDDVDMARTALANCFDKRLMAATIRPMLGEPRTYESGPMETLRKEVAAASGCANGDLSNLMRALDQVSAHVSAKAKWKRAKECGSPLYYATPSPRRVPLAKYLAKQYASAFDFVIADEAHEYASQSSAQSVAAQRLFAMGAPVLSLTGTHMNGYAENLFVRQWMTDPSFRDEFDRTDVTAFVRKYGYVRRARSVKDDRNASGQEMTYGKCSDRIATGGERIIGAAPGVLDLFVLKHLLRTAVTLQKKDLAVAVPTCHEERVTIEPSPEQGQLHLALERGLRERMREDKKIPELAGSLLGQLAELPSFLDRATSDQGNGYRAGQYVIVYPKDAPVVNREVCGVECIDEAVILPKEQWMLDKVGAELDEGRNVLVFAWHVSLFDRYAALLKSAHGVTAPVLRNVSTSKRKDWIQTNIVDKGVRVMLVNPLVVQTGLNNLVHFSTQIWMENPGCDPRLYRQAVGRIDRPNQKRETRVFFPVYSTPSGAKISQELTHKILMHKVSVSSSFDGQDGTAALKQAGVGKRNAIDAMSVGRQLYAMME